MMTPEPPDGFEITESVEPTGVHLIVSGELDVAVAGRLQNRLEELADAGEAVRLDLSRLAFIDSSGLNVIVTAHRHAQQDDWDLTIDRTLSLPVERVVQLMGLDTVFWS